MSTSLSVYTKFIYISLQSKRSYLNEPRLHITLNVCGGTGKFVGLITFIPFHVITNDELSMFIAG